MAAASVAVLALGAAYSTGSHLLVGFQAAAFTAPGPALARYLATQEAISPGAQARLTTVAQDPPSGRGAPDAIHVQGSCDALYVETGEDADRWLLAERRSVVVTARLEPDFTASSSIIVTIGTEPRRWIRLQTNDDGQARVVLQHEEDPWYGPWFDVLPPYEIRIGVRDLPGGAMPRSARRPAATSASSAHSAGVGLGRRPIPIEVSLADSADWPAWRAPGGGARSRSPHCRADPGRPSAMGERGRARCVTFLTWRDQGHPDGGGSEVYVESVARELVRRGHRVQVRCARYPGSARREMSQGSSSYAGAVASRSTPARCGGPSSPAAGPTSSSTSSTAYRSCRPWRAAGASSRWCTTCIASSGASSTRAGVVGSGGGSRAGSRPGSTATSST